MTKVSDTGYGLSPITLINVSKWGELRIEETLTVKNGLDIAELKQQL